MGRHRLLRVAPALADPGPERLVLSGEMQGKIAAAMAQLSPSERLAFTLRHVEGLPIKEVAAAMGLKSEAAKNSVFRAVRKMRTVLEPLVQVAERRA